MKKLFTILVLLVLMAMMGGADIKRSDTDQTKSTLAVKEPCLGYTIIEFGTGVDCQGDTVKLTKLNGVQVLAAR